MRGRVPFLALAGILIFVVGVAHAWPGWGLVVPIRPVIYRIEGYLDRAPEGTQVLERVHLGGPSGQQRAFLMTSYRRSGNHGDPWTLVRDLGAYHPDFILQGPPKTIAQILDAPAGAHIQGTFQYLAGTHSLLVNPYDLKID
jgi:hypothetical protein